MSRSFLKLKKKKLPLKCIFCIRPKSNSKNIKATINHSHSLRYNFYMSNRAIISRSYRIKMKVEQSPLNIVPSWCQPVFLECLASVQTAIVRVSVHSSALRNSSEDCTQSHYFLSIASPSEWPATEKHRNKGAEARWPRHLSWTTQRANSLSCSPGLCAKNDKNICVGLLKQQQKSFWYTENALLLGILRKMRSASK